MAVRWRMGKERVELEAAFGGVTVGWQASCKPLGDCDVSTATRLTSLCLLCRNLAERVPGTLQTSNRGELLASRLSSEIYLSSFQD